MAGRWLLKTEPEEWSWEQQHANGGVSHWDGVRNAQAQKHLRAMAKGDLCFFYHSGAKAKEIVGITRVCKTFYPDPSDPASKHGMIDIEAVSKLVLPLPLSRLKQEDRLHSFIMFRQPRLSVLPVGSSEWELICELAGELEPPSPLDHGTVSLKVCNGEASPFSSDDNGTFRMRVNKQELELSDGETRVSIASMNEEMKLSLSEENAGFRVSERAAISCNDETRVSLTDMIDKPSQSFTVHRRSRRERPKVIDGSRVKATGAVVTTEGLRPRGKSRVTDVDRIQLPRISWTIIRLPKKGAQMFMKSARQQSLPSMENGFTVDETRS